MNPLVLYLYVTAVQAVILRVKNPMTSSQNCTCQQSLVNLLDQHNISVEQNVLHSR